MPIASPVIIDTSNVNNILNPDSAVRDSAGTIWVMNAQYTSASVPIIRKSTDDGATWSVAAFPDGSSPTSPASTISNARLKLGGGKAYFIIATNAVGVTVFNLTDNIGTLANVFSTTASFGSFGHDLCVAPNGRLMVAYLFSGTTGSAVYSDDFGATWTGRSTLNVGTSTNLGSNPLTITADSDSNFYIFSAKYVSATNVTLAMTKFTNSSSTYSSLNNIITSSSGVYVKRPVASFIKGSDNIGRIIITYCVGTTASANTSGTDVKWMESINGGSSWSTPATIINVPAAGAPNNTAYPMKIFFDSINEFVIFQFGPYSHAYAFYFRKSLTGTTWVSSNSVLTNTLSSSSLVRSVDTPSGYEYVSGFDAIYTLSSPTYVYYHKGGAAFNNKLDPSTILPSSFKTVLNKRPLIRYSVPNTDAEGDTLAALVVKYSTADEPNFDANVFASDSVSIAKVSGSFAYTRPSVDLPTGTTYIRVIAYDNYDLSTYSFIVHFGVTPTDWENNEFVANSGNIKASSVAYLVQQLNLVRVAYGLAEISGLTIEAGVTEVSAADLLLLRTSFEEIVMAIGGQSSVTWAVPSIVPGSTIRDGAHWKEIQDKLSAL